MEVFSVARRYYSFKVDDKKFVSLLHYPTDSSGDFLPRFTESESEAISQVFFKGSNSKDLSSLKFFASDSGPFSQRHKVYPVVFFCAPGLPSAHQEITRRLAAQGYVTFSMYHSSASIVESPSCGKVVNQDKSFEDREKAIVEDFLQLHKHLQSGDCEYSVFLDLCNLHLVGFSLGGSAAVKLSQFIDCVATCTNIDGSMFGEKLKSISKVPLLFVDHDFSTSGISESDLQEHLDSRAYIFNSPNVVLHNVSVPDSNHRSFSDISYLQFELGNLIDQIECVELLPLLTSIDTILRFLEQKAL